MRTRTLLLGVLLLTGCASSTVWTRESFTPQEFKRDDYECRQESTTHAGGPGGLLGVVVMIVAQREANATFRQCMEARGWTATKE